MTLTRAEQQVLVHDLCQHLEQEIIQAIKHDRIPAEWTGHELRQLIADRALSQIAYMKMTPARAKAYRNDVAVNNL